MPGARRRTRSCRATRAPRCGSSCAGGPSRGDERFEVSTIEVERGGPSFTVDTLRELHERRPEDQLTFIAGGDMARSLPSWREPERRLQLAALRWPSARAPPRRHRARAGGPGAASGVLLRHAARRRLLLAGARARRRRAADPLPRARRGRRVIEERGSTARRRVSGAMSRRDGTRGDGRRDRGLRRRPQGDRPVELDLRGVLGYTDYFVICTGNTERQIKAIHDAIHQGMKKEHGMLPRRVEGASEGRWILMDYLDVVVHVFTPETRSSTGSSTSGARCRRARRGPPARSPARRRPRGR